jgi:serine/threonine protein kinase
LKCDNVLIDARRGDCIEAKICDFGSAKVVSSHNTRNRKGRSKLSSGSTIGIVGTPMYSPPEVLQGGSMSIQAPFLAVRSDAPIGHEGPDGRESLIDTMAETKEGVNGMSLIFGWDIFSFGVLMYCVTHDCLLPYTSVIMENEEMFNGAILDGARPEVDLKKVTTTEKVLMEFCWSADHNQRPHASKIVQALKEESGN